MNPEKAAAGPHDVAHRSARRAVDAFFRRDLRVALSYRIPFLLEFAAIAFTVLMYLFVAKLVPAGTVPGGYFAFVLVGLTVATFLRAGVSVLGANVRGEQVQGTLEALLACGLPVSSIALGMSAYPMASAWVSAVIYLAVGALAGARSVPNANWPLALAAVLLGSVAFVGVGLAGATLVLVFRRAAAVTGWLVAIMALAGGEIFPPELLPGWLGALSVLSPFTQVLDLTRAALLEGADWPGSLRHLAVIGLEAAAYMVLGLWLLALGLRHGRRTGGLSQY